MYVCSYKGGTTKVQEMRLECYGHVVRIEEHYIGMRATEKEVQDLGQDSWIE